MKSKVDIEKKYKVETWADVEFLACRSDKRVPGLGRELVTRAVAIMGERGVKVPNNFYRTCKPYRIFSQSVSLTQYVVLSVCHPVILSSCPPVPVSLLSK